MIVNKYVSFTVKGFFSLLLSCVAIFCHAQKAELRIPIGHTSPVQAVSISPDEKYAATAASDKSIKIWSIGDGRQIKTLQTKQGAWYQVKFMADSRHLTVRLENGWEYWDALTGKMEYQFIDPSENLYTKKSFSLSADGSKVCVTSNSTVEIKQASNGTMETSFSWNNTAETVANFNEIRFNSNYLGCVNKNKLTLFNLKTKLPIQLTLPDDNTKSIDMAPDNNELYVNAQSHVYKINLDTKKVTVIQDFGASEGSNFSGDGKYYIIADLSLIDRSTNSQVKHFYLDGMYASTASAKYFVCFNRSTGNGMLYSMKTFEKIKDFSNETSWLQQMTVNYKNSELAFTTDNKEARLWNLKNFSFEKTVNLNPGNNVDNPTSTYSLFSQQGNYYLSSAFSKKSIINYYTGELLYNSPRNILDISPDGKIGFIEESGNGEIINLATGNVIKKIDVKYPRYFASPDNQTVVYHQYPESQVSIYNYRNNTEIKAVLQIGDYPKFSIDGSKIYSLGFTYDNTNGPHNFLIASVKTGTNISTTPIVKIDGRKMIKFAVSLDEKMVSVIYQDPEDYKMTNNNIIITYEIGTGREISRLNNISGGNDLIYLDEKYNLAALSIITNTVEILNPVSKKHLIDITHFKSINDWIAVTPDGLYDGNMESLKKFYFVKGNDIVDPGAYFEKFYIPNLFPRIMAGEKLTAEVNIKSAPVAKIQYAEKQRNLTVDDDVPSYQNTTGVAEITVNASATDDAIDEIRLFLNGKVLNVTARNLIVEDDKSAIATKKYIVTLLPGKNEIRAIALNTQRTESRPDIIDVIYNATASANVNVTPVVNNNSNAIVDQIDKNATMYLMVVGINAYTKKINPLAYALPDATAFKEEIEKDAKSVLANVKSYFITDAGADKESILNAFAEIKRDARPQDIFVFYYAGHGYINPANKEFYLVSANVTDAGESLLKNGIPAKELQNYAVDIQAQKQLFVLDACQSAGAFETMLQHNGEQQKSLALVARSTGTHWMAASGSTETAKEFGQLGHGAFTYVLLQALKGQAAANKMITVNGLKNFLQIQVPELVKKYGGNNQSPASYGFGNDFPVELIK